VAAPAINEASKGACGPRLRSNALRQDRLGPIEIHGHSEMSPAWRPLLGALSETVPLFWVAGPRHVPDWLRDTRVEIRIEAPSGAQPILFSCATPQHEVLEAFRWVRKLLAIGMFASRARASTWSSKSAGLAAAMAISSGRAVPDGSSKEMAAAFCPACCATIFSSCRLARWTAPTGMPVSAEIARTVMPAASNGATLACLLS